MHVGILLNGDEPSREDLRLLDACEKVVCADGGANAMMKIDRPPDAVVGDMDSVDVEVYKWLDALDVDVREFPREKDETDGELALAAALELGAKRIMFLGAHGQRTAMFLANLKMLRSCHEQGLDAVMVGHEESMRFVGAGGEFAITGRAGATLNVLAVGADATITLEGTDWDAQNIGLPQFGGRGLSNKVTEDGARLQVHNGLALVILERAPA